MKLEICFLHLWRVARHLRRLFRIQKDSPVFGQVVLPWFLGLSLISCSRSLVAQPDNNAHNLLLRESVQKSLSKLQQPCRLWSQQSLRATLEEISRQYELPIWLDREVDPGRVLNLPAAEEQSDLLGELQRLASSLGLESGLIENVYFLADPGKFARVQKAAVVLHGQLSAAKRPEARVARSLEWPEITSSNELLDAIREAWMVDIEGALPHDLYRAGKWPESTLATQLALLLGGFQLQAVARFDKAKETSDTESTAAGPPRSAGREQPHSAASPSPILQPDDSRAGLHLGIEPLTQNPIWQDIYPVQLAQERIAEFMQRYPGSRLDTLAPRRIRARGPTNLHLDILAARIRTDRRPVAGSNSRQQRYSFRTETALPTETILQNLANSFQLRIEWSKACTQAHRNRLIQPRVENAARAELLEEVCRLAKLRMEIHDSTMILYPIQED